MGGGGGRGGGSGEDKDDNFGSPLLRFGMLDGRWCIGSPHLRHDEQLGLPHWRAQEQLLLWLRMIGVQEDY
ncbi:uncharacterized protein Bfra_001486 [Botrytis fragariae]|uniref:Uncharacterized protein n=1 Tax=Botrytis fragariae TaxID=1964551 RepID=A0A8H6EM27_9HELO|nr:uncharacterized protein Bfra_001486 [Botrytis fragariae]KAF5877124.1 hypothetical protein Bfra_001486 [Botrytis fragariae]